jgi:hypothetical protein
MKLIQESSDYNLFEKILTNDISLNLILVLVGVCVFALFILTVLGLNKLVTYKRDWSRFIIIVVIFSLFFSVFSILFDTIKTYSGHIEAKHASIYEGSFEVENTKTSSNSKLIEVSDKSHKSHHYELTYESKRSNSGEKTNKNELHFHSKFDYDNLRRGDQIKLKINLPRQSSENRKQEDLSTLLEDGHIKSVKKISLISYLLSSRKWYN